MSYPHSPPSARLWNPSLRSPVPLFLLLHRQRFPPPYTQILIVYLMPLATPSQASILEAPSMESERNSNVRPLPSHRVGQTSWAGDLGGGGGGSESRIQLAVLSTDLQGTSMGPRHLREVEAEYFSLAGVRGSLQRIAKEYVVASDEDTLWNVLDVMLKQPNHQTLLKLLL